MPETTRMDRKRAARLHESITLLENSHPDLSARTPGGVGGIVVAVMAVLTVVLSLVLATVGTLVVGSAFILALYLCALSYRVRLVVRRTDHKAMIEISAEEARAIPDGDLPVYTIL